MKYKNIYICSLCRAMARHEIPLEKKPLVKYGNTKIEGEEVAE